jgi:hypothetical protein
MNDAFERDMELALEKLRRHRNGEPQPTMRTRAPRPSHLVPIIAADAVETPATCDHSHLYGVYIPGDGPADRSVQDRVKVWHANPQDALEIYAKRKLAAFTARHPAIAVCYFEGTDDGLPSYSACTEEEERQNEYARDLAQFELELLAGLAEDEGEGNLEEYDGFDAEYDDAREVDEQGRADFQQPTYLLLFPSPDKPQMMSPHALSEQLKHEYYYNDGVADARLYVIKPGGTTPLEAFAASEREGADGDGWITFRTKVTALIPLDESTVQAGAPIHIVLRNGTFIRDAEMIAFRTTTLHFKKGDAEMIRHVSGIRAIYTRELVDEFTWQVDGQA